MLLLYKETLFFSTSVQILYISLQLEHLIMKTNFFELQLKFHMNVRFGFFMVEDFPSIIRLHTPHLSFLHFEITYLVYS